MQSSFFKVLVIFQHAFEEGEWGKMSARDRGRLLYRLADELEHHRQELATIESIDSGAVYTLALKTHVGMSIDVWRYFAGWCDKIEASLLAMGCITVVSMQRSDKWCRISTTSGKMLPAGA